MSTHTKTGDALLSEDLNLIKTRLGTEYLAYPSCVTPWFLVPKDDAVAQRFVLTIIFSDYPSVRALLRVPGLAVVAVALLFKKV